MLHCAGFHFIPTLESPTMKIRSMLSACMLCLVPLAAHGQAPADKPLMAYIGTFSSPLKDTLPTQVDLPPVMDVVFICFKSIAPMAH